MNAEGTLIKRYNAALGESLGSLGKLRRNHIEALEDS